jgi:hypothetical protein
MTTEGASSSEPRCAKCGNEPATAGQRWGRLCRAASKRKVRAERSAERKAARAANNWVGGVGHVAERPAPGEPEGERFAAVGNADNAGELVEILDAPIGEAGETVQHVVEHREVVQRITSTRPAARRTDLPTPAEAGLSPYQPYVGVDPRESWYGTYLTFYAAEGGPKLAAAAVGLAMRTVNAALKADPAFAEEYEAAGDYYNDFLEWSLTNLGRSKNNALAMFGRLKARMPQQYHERAQLAALGADAGSHMPDGSAATEELLRTLMRSATDATLAEWAAGARDEQAARQALPPGDTISEDPQTP